MRGAVLHGLGLDLVKERLMRRSYGVVIRPVFRDGVHPEERKYRDEAGTFRCRGVMQWFARKVHQISPI